MWASAYNFTNQLVLCYLITVEASSNKSEFSRETLLFTNASSFRVTETCNFWISNPFWVVGWKFEHIFGVNDIKVIDLFQISEAKLVDSIFQASSYNQIKVISKNGTLKSLIISEIR